MLTCIRQFISTRHHQRIVGNVYNAFKVGHLCSINHSGHHIAHKQQFCLAVVYDVMNLVSGKLVQNRHCHGTIGKRCQESYSPTGTIASAQSNFVSWLHSTVFKHDVQLLNFSCYIMILQGSAFKVGEGIAIPITDDALFYELVETLNFHLFIVLCLCACSSNTRMS